MSILRCLEQAQLEEKKAQKAATDALNHQEAQQPNSAAEAARIAEAAADRAHALFYQAQDQPGDPLHEAITVTYAFYRSARTAANMAHAAANLAYAREEAHHALFIALQLRNPREWPPLPTDHPHAGETTG